MPDNDWSPSLYDQKHAFVYEYGKDLISLLAPQPGELILDLGCGTGHLTKQLADTGARLVGLDSSDSMIETARQNYPDVEFVVADGKDFAFSYQFDAIFSNAALHWMNEPERVVVAMSRALKSGGRLVAEFGGKGNVSAIITTTRQVMKELLGRDIDFGWYFPSIGEYAALLEKHCLAVHYAFLFDRPTRLEDGEKGLRNWLQMFGERIFQTGSEDEKMQVFEKVEERLHNTLFKDGSWFADYRRLRVVANKE